MNGKCFSLDYRKATGFWSRSALRWFRAPLEALLGFNRLNAIYRRVIESPSEEPFAARVLKAMRVSVEVDPAELGRVPAEGAVVVVANHPFGGIEGVLLLAQLRKLRPDVRAMANYMLSAISEMREDFIFVNPFGGNGAARENVRAMRECREWLEGGHLLIVFPAGEVAHYSPKARRVVESEWKRNIGTLIVRSGATVVPMHFKGCNGALFQLAGFIHPLARTISLPRQFANKCAKRFELSVGRAVAPETVARIVRDGGDCLRFLRFRSEALRFKGMKRRASAARVDAPIAPEESAEAVAAELEALPERYLLLQECGFAVYAVPGESVPAVMRELGRLRELCFRAVGEGTGKERDIDEFDGRYRQLVLWNLKDRRIAGAYRMGLTDELHFSGRAAPRCYTATLFKIDAKAFAELPRAIELGRSFVCPGYQRSITALFMLWKGIAAFVAANPGYRLLFGPVSVSNDYSPASRAAIAEVLSAYFGSSAARGVFAARRAPKIPSELRSFIAGYADLLKDTANLNELVCELEEDGKGLPVLLRQYLGLNGRFAAFNVDADFADALDGLVAVDLPYAGEKTLRRYMGAESAAAYLSLHGVKCGGGRDG